MDEGGEVELVKDEGELAVGHLPLVFATGEGLECREVAGLVVESLDAREVGREVEEGLLQAVVGDAFGEEGFCFGLNEGVDSDVGANGKGAVEEVGIGLAGHGGGVVGEDEKLPLFVEADEVVVLFEGIEGHGEGHGGGGEMIFHWFLVLEHGIHGLHEFFCLFF